MNQEVQQISAEEVRAATNVKVMQDLYEGSVTNVNFAVGITEGFKVKVGRIKGRP